MVPYPVSEGLRTFLEEKGFEVRNRPGLLDVSRTSNQSSWYILFVFSLVAAMLLLSGWNNGDVFWMMMGVVTLLIAVMVFFTLLYATAKGKRGLIDLRIDDQHESIAIRYDGKSHYWLMSQVRSFKWNSRFIAEYSSAFKNTSQEFELIFQLQTNEGLVTIFDCTSDYDEPRGVILEWYNTLNESFSLASQTSST